MQEKQAKLPNDESRQYLHLKVEYAMRFPRLSVKTRRNGSAYNVNLKQLMMSGMIRIDEVVRDYFWYYKAEVSFDMRVTPPCPYLSSQLKQKDKANRRHTTNPFPVKGKGIYRRPDIIIVKDKYDRWPGLARLDADGYPHADNLERLVEVKFPGDNLSDRQYQDYMLIVGGSEKRFTILEIHDCRTDEGKETDRVLNLDRQGVSKYWPMFFFPPIFLPGPPQNPKPARIEPWTYASEPFADLVEGVVDGVAEGWNALSAEMQRKVSHVASWVNDSGRWFYQRLDETWVWVSDTGMRVEQWTNEQLRAAWLQIQKVTDMTLDTLKQVNWVQILTDAAVAVGVILVAVGIGLLVVTLSIPEAILGAILLIVRLAIMSWETLAVILGAGAGTAVLATN
jgi:hypothetical protein